MEVFLVYLKTCEKDHLILITPEMMAAINGSVGIIKILIAQVLFRFHFFFQENFDSSFANVDRTLIVLNSVSPRESIFV